MKNIGKKLSLLLCGVLLVANITGCTNAASISDTTEEKIEVIGKTESVSEEVPIAEYGDTVSFECTETIEELVWEDKGEKIFTVDDNTDVFFPIIESDIISETDVNRYQRQVVGKHVGDSFMLCFEDEAGCQRRFEYTILEILDKNMDMVELNDRLYTTYTMRRRPKEFENTAEGFVETQGDAVFTVSEYSYEFTPNMMEYDMLTARDNVNRVLGKKVGEIFRIFDELSQASYQYTINKIEKAVAHGDKIRTSVRESCACISKDIKTRTVQHKEASLELRFTPQNIVFCDKELSAENSRGLINCLTNIKLGEEVVFWCGTHRYDIKLTEIQKGNISPQVQEAEMSLLLANEEVLHFLSKPGGDGWFGAVVLDDAVQNFEVYIVNDSAGCIEQVQKMRYSIEYDMNWKIVAEHLEGDSNLSYAYIYNSDGKYVQRKVYTSGILDYIDYFNEEGTVITERHYYMDGDWIYYIDFYKDGILSCRIGYTEDGYETESYEKDEWGFETGM